MNYLTNYYKNLSEQLQERKAQLERLLNEQKRSVPKSDYIPPDRALLVPTNAQAHIVKGGMGAMNPLNSIGARAGSLASGLAKGGAYAIGTVAGDLAAEVITSTPAWERRMDSLGKETERAMSGMSPSEQDETIKALDLAYDTTSFVRDPIGTVTDKEVEEVMAKIKKTAPATQQEYDVAAAEARLRRARRGIQTYD
jgi:hypothetical protein